MVGYNCALIFIFFTLQFPKAGASSLFLRLVSLADRLVPPLLSQIASEETPSNPGGATKSFPILATLKGFVGRRWERESHSDAQVGRHFATGP
ncbi:hypothetical protein BDY24DRAFT_381045 [Mrakia frigida]|uniref:uncharacterized protein n=1 Tax=Mrakia frigida TaxID=29902 RepID=UPI003FCC08E6